jgi:hypothetical protein
MTPAMPNSRILVAGSIVTTLSLGVGGCNNDQLKGAKAEVQQGKIKVTVPTVPAFEVPTINADGSHTVKELRVLGSKFLKTEISIHGYVRWKYDCETAIRQPNEDDVALKKRIELDPTLCRRPAFYVGDAVDTPVERAAWVVEVPRAPTEAEKKNLPKEEIKAWPIPPVYNVGDEITVTGSWLVSSPHGENNTDGLLVYKSMKNVTQNLEFLPPVDPTGLPPATIQAPPH